MRGQKNKRGRHGFTLIEVMCALLVFAVLAGIAYPSYVEAVRKSKRMEGRAALFLAMQEQERHYSQHGSYVPFSASLSEGSGKRFKWYSGQSATNSAYEIKAEACDNEAIRDCVQLVAMPGTPNVDGRYDDPICGPLILTSTGVRRAKRSDCWQ